MNSIISAKILLDFFFFRSFIFCTHSFQTEGYKKTNKKCILSIGFQQSSRWNTFSNLLASHSSIMKTLRYNMNSETKRFQTKRFTGLNFVFAMELPMAKSKCFNGKLDETFVRVTEVHNVICCSYFDRHSNNIWLRLNISFLEILLQR